MPKKLPTFHFELTWQEYNYVTKSLHDCAREMRMGSGGGNTPYLIRFTEKTLKKLERLQQAQLRKYLGETEWRKRRRLINQCIRNATRKGGRK